MPKRPRHSRWSRLPATFRSGEKHISGPDTELQRLTLYLPGAVLDRAEVQAKQAGVESLQAYCELILRAAIERKDAPGKTGNDAEKGFALDWIEEITNDPEYLAAWSSGGHPPSGGDTPSEARDASGSSAMSDSRQLGTVLFENSESQGFEGTPSTETPSNETTTSRAAMLVLKHAGLAGEFPDGLIPSFRRGEPIAPEAAQELLQALIALEAEFRPAEFINRRLAFALHRLSFEGQLLVTEAWPGASPDQGTVETLRMVQEAVDRVLSGEDIRYYSAEEVDGPSVEDQPGYG